MHDYYLNEIGIERWKLRAATQTAPAQYDDFENLQSCVAACFACGLSKTRKQTVFGTGNRAARLMFIGEAPGADEDRQGKPFVGRAGLLLTEMIHAIGFTRDEVFIANILKCRPPNNRDPMPCEVQSCTPFLLKQIDMIKPKLLVALGRIAAQFLLKTSESLTRLRGKNFTYGENNTPLLVTFHPAYLLRQPLDKAKAYEDLLRVKNQLRGIKDA